jgi:hypothetical protein
MRLLDGPCQGNYLVKRAPVYLRAVKDKSGETDVLDQLEDTPKDTETVYVYKLVDGTPGTIHLYGKNISGWFAIADYRYMSEVDGETLRDTVVWREWAIKQLTGVEF